MAIGCVKIAKERLELVEEFIPKINGWGICDSFCAGFKFIKKNKELVWDFLEPYLKSNEDSENYFWKMSIENQGRIYLVKQLNSNMRCTP